MACNSALLTAIMSFAQPTDPSSHEYQEEMFPQFQCRIPLSTFRSVSSDVSPLKPLLLPLSPRSINSTDNDDDANLKRQISQPLRSTPSLAPITRVPLSLRSAFPSQPWMDTTMSVPQQTASINTPVSLHQQQSNPPGCIQEDEEMALVPTPMNDMTTAQHEQYDLTGYESDLDSMYLPAPAADEATYSSQKFPMSSVQGGSLLSAISSQSLHR